MTADQHAPSTGQPESTYKRVHDREHTAYYETDCPYCAEARHTCAYRAEAESLRQQLAAAQTERDQARDAVDHEREVMLAESDQLRAQVKAMRAVVEAARNLKAWVRAGADSAIARRHLEPLFATVDAATAEQLRPVKADVLSMPPQPPTPECLCSCHHGFDGGCLEHRRLQQQLAVAERDRDQYKSDRDWAVQRMHEQLARADRFLGERDQLHKVLEAGAAFREQHLIGQPRTQGTLYPMTIGQEEAWHAEWDKRLEALFAAIKDASAGRR